MSDIYHIPNDNGVDYRLKKFVEYQHEVPSIHYRFLGEWIKRKKLRADDAVNLSFIMSATYNEITCLLLWELLRNHGPGEIWKQYKSVLNFGSARKYAKNNDYFPGLMRDWEIVTAGRPYKWVRKLCTFSPEKNYRIVQRELCKIKNVGRFASDLFMEMIVYLGDYLSLRVKEPLMIDWKNCANLTSGVYNIFYEDERANRFDREKTVTSAEKMFLSKKLLVIQDQIKQTYPEQNAEISMFIGKICSFRNLFKNARYGGFHHDRQLGVIRDYQRELPQFDYLWRECLELRREMFPDRFLGEIHGWNGIRPERKKLWLRTGLTGAEK